MTLISEAYRKEQEALHAKGGYGTASLQFGNVVTDLINRLNIMSVLDYGCGSMQNLLKVLRPDHDIFYNGYDPGVQEYSDSPEPADLVVCIDVLEHIEPDLLDNVLNDLQRVSPKWFYATVHTGPARKMLSDGRNAHLIQKHPLWWLEHLYKRWDVRQYQAIPTGFAVLCRSLPTQSYKHQ